MDLAALTAIEETAKKMSMPSTPCAASQAVHLPSMPFYLKRHIKLGKSSRTPSTSAPALRLLLGLLPVLLPGATWAQTEGTAATDPVPVARGARTATPPTIDGLLAEDAWTEAPVITNFVQHEPFEGQPATERTEIRILFDADALYIGAWMFDRDPAGIRTGENRRDANLRDADALMIVLDTFLDRQNAYVFRIQDTNLLSPIPSIALGTGGVQPAG